MNAHDYRNGHNSDDESDVEDDLQELNEEGWAERLLRGLNAMRKSRQNYDVILSGEDGGEVPAHRAVLAGATPHLLNILPCSDLAKVPVSGTALITLVEFMYTGRVKVPSPKETLGLYKAAAYLRVEPVRGYCAQLLVQSLTPQDCLMVRDLPDLGPDEKAAVDKYIADNFNSICECGAISALPELRVEVVGTGNSEAEAGAEAEAVLDWCRSAVEGGDITIEDASKRTHLLYVSEGLLRDCGSLPAASGDAPELGEYRRRRACSPRRTRPATRPAARPATRWAVLAASCRKNHTTTAIIDAQGRLLLLRLLRSPLAAGNSSDATLPHLGGCIPCMSRGRCAHGGCAVGDGRVVVCGGYDRAEVVRGTEVYDPHSNTWTPAADMRGPRARFSAALLKHNVIAVGGSDGHHELDTVESYDPLTNKWTTRAKLPVAVQHAGTASSGTELYLVGGWTNGNCLKTVYRYTWDEDKWTEAPSLLQGRSQTAGVWWRGAVWAVGGCDKWHCLDSTETWDTTAPDNTWVQGPALPTARRSVGGTVWRERLVAAGGSDGAASLRSVVMLDDPRHEWTAGPPLRRPRASPALVVAGNALLAVGGFSGQEFLSCAECLHEFDGQWTSLLDPAKPQKSITENGTDNERDGTKVEQNGTKVEQNGTKVEQNGTKTEQYGTNSQTSESEEADKLKAKLKACEGKVENEINS